MKRWKTAGIWLASLLVSSLVSGAIGFYVGKYLGRSSEEEKIAQYAVVAMLPGCPVKDSKELETRVATYLSALKRARADGRGAPVWREDCTIGVEWSITIPERIRLH